MEQQENNVNMEQQILSVAEVLFLEKGFALTSTTEIALRVGCNQALIHYYFRTKENLFRKLFENKIAMFAKTFFSIDSKSSSFEELLTKTIEAHFDILEQNPKLPFLLINEVTTNPKRLEALKKNIGDMPLKIINEFEIHLKKAIQNKEVREITVKNLIMNMISMNVITFLSIPLLSISMTEQQIKEHIKDRKKEIVRTILLSLRPEL